MDAPVTPASRTAPATRHASATVPHSAAPTRSALSRCQHGWHHVERT